MRVVLIVATFCFFTEQEARADFTICNQTNRDLLFAGVFDTSILFEDSWRAYGWVTVKSNRCHKAWDHVDKFQIYLSILRERDDGSWQLQLAEPGRRSTNYKTVEQFFCVNYESGFNSLNKPLQDHTQNCPLGWKLHLFNYFYEIPSNSNFTLDVR